jgi:hypothetical protein
MPINYERLKSRASPTSRNVVLVLGAQPNPGHRAIGAISALKAKKVMISHSEKLRPAGCWTGHWDLKCNRLNPVVRPGLDSLDRFDKRR